MNAKKLYEQLEKDFIKKEMSDDWQREIQTIQEFITANFKERSTGLVCDNTDEINKVYTAVFPSNKVMQEIINKNEKNAMLFVHHPAIWDIRCAPNVFQEMNKELLKEFKKRKIAIYNLHVPLDAFGEYSTSVTLANELNIKIEKSFAPYHEVLCGVIGTTNAKTIQELKEKLAKKINHEAKLYDYGTQEITNQRIAIIAGGGNDLDMLEEIHKEKINTFITGISAKSNHSKKSHEFLEKHKINLLGGTHYSTEKFACIAMIQYFTKIGLNAEYIEDDPIIEDL